MRAGNTWGEIEKNAAAAALQVAASIVSRSARELQDRVQHLGAKGLSIVLLDYQRHRFLDCRDVKRPGNRGFRLLVS